LKFHSIRHASWPGRILLPGLLLGVALVFWPARELRSDNFVFYFPGNRQVISLRVIQGVKYLPLLTVLNMVGKVSGLQEKRDSLKVWFGNTPLEFTLDDPKVRVDKAQLTLSNPVRVSDGQWQVPVDFLTSVLPRVTTQIVEYPLGSTRAFIGDVKPTSFTVRLDQLSNGARLTLQFTDKVAVRTVASNGKWILFLGDHPVEPLEQTYEFKDPYVSELRFDDQDGIPKLILTPTSANLNFYPAMAEGGKVLLADIMKPSPVTAQQPPSSPAPPAGEPAAPPVPAPPQTPSPAVAPSNLPLPVVVLDAGHGGEDSGARGRDGVLEKDLDAQLVARIRMAVLATQKYRVLLTRTGDVTTSFEQRALVANENHAVCFLTFHAGDLGPDSPQVAIYTYGPPDPLTGESHPQLPSVFVPWARVQRLHLDQSRALAATLHQELSLLAGVKVDSPVAAPVRTLRSVNGPAVAIELGRLSPEVDASSLTSPAFQQSVAGAIARVLTSLHGGGG
jgi:N-acetylmuramoyl-L-alanine amidase